MTNLLCRSSFTYLKVRIAPRSSNIRQIRSAQLISIRILLFKQFCFSMRNWRVNIVFIFLALLLAAVIGRLFYLQIIRSDYYTAFSQGQQGGFQLTKGERGEIFFKGGEILATNIKGSYVFLNPQKTENKEETAKTIAQILNLEESAVLEKIAKDSSFELIKNNLTPEEEDTLKGLNLKGATINESIFRKYPQETMASQVVGFLGGEGSGQYGLEEYYDHILRGKESIQRKGWGAVRYFLSSDEESTEGADIYLTLDYNIQYLAEKLLREIKENLNIEGGTIIVMEPSSGKILAMANFPNFNPNDYSKTEDFKIFQNGAIQKFFEPGSMFKTITMASALNEEKITPETIYIDKGEVKIGGYTIYNFNKKIWGEKSMTEVLENSINTGAVFVQKQLGKDIFLKYLEKFNFFKPTDVDLKGEIYSENKELKKGYEINFATASFGQGIEITPLQLVRAVGAIANGGKLVKPYLVEKIVREKETIETKPEISLEPIISSKTISQLTAMMVSVVDNGGAKRAKIPGYFIAGKTGTSQIPFPSLGISQKGYSDKTWQSFVGFAPAFNPRFVILVKLDNPGSKEASGSVVPIFRELADYIINYLQIPPDYE